MDDNEEVMPGEELLDMLRELRAGKTVDELEREMRDLVKRCRDTGKAGELVLKLKIKPIRAGEGTYSLKDEIVVKQPQFDRVDTTFFGTPDGKLTRSDPRQRPLEFTSGKKVDDDAATPRRV